MHISKECMWSGFVLFQFFFNIKLFWWSNLLFVLLSLLTRILMVHSSDQQMSCKTHIHTYCSCENQTLIRINIDTFHSCFRNFWVSKRNILSYNCCITTTMSNNVLCVCNSYSGWFECFFAIQSINSLFVSHCKSIIIGFIHLGSEKISIFVFFDAHTHNINVIAWISIAK